MADKKKETVENVAEEIVGKDTFAVDEVYDPFKDLVRIKLHKSKEQSDDLFVSVNDYNYLIQRGVYVEVPRFIAEVIDHSEMQDALTLEKIEQASKRAEQI